MSRTRHKGKLWVLRDYWRHGIAVHPWAFNEKHCRGLCCQRTRKPVPDERSHLLYEADATDWMPG